jgi:hypothetical protein
MHLTDIMLCSIVQCFPCHSIDIQCSLLLTTCVFVCIFSWVLCVGCWLLLVAVGCWLLLVVVSCCVSKPLPQDSAAEEQQTIRVKNDVNVRKVYHCYYDDYVV